MFQAESQAKAESNFEANFYVCYVITFSAKNFLKSNFLIPAFR